MKKVGIQKQARTNKQESKATQHTQGSQKNELPRVGLEPRHSTLYTLEHFTNWLGPNLTSHCLHLIVYISLFTSHCLHLIVHLMTMYMINHNSLSCKQLCLDVHACTVCWVNLWYMQMLNVWDNIRRVQEFYRCVCVFFCRVS